MGKLATRLATVADRSGVLTRALSARRAGWGQPGLLVVLYHRVAPLSEIGELDPDLIDATPEDFDQQMGYLREHFHPVSLEDVLAAHRAGQDLPPGSVLVTFDDGYLDNFQYAFPILQKHGMKGLFFISTGHLTDRRLFWWERLAMSVRRSQRASAHIEYPAPEDFDCSSEVARAKTIRRLNRIVKDYYDLDLDRFYQQISDAFAVPWSTAEERALADSILMSWDQVRQLRAGGMGIGSHTRAHRVLQTLKADELLDELMASRETLEKEIGESITTIAYPVGKAITGITPVRAALQKAGYELGFTTKAGLNRFAGTPDPFDLKRLSIDREVPIGLKHTWMTFPFLAP